MVFGHLSFSVSYKWTALPLPTEENPEGMVNTPYQRYGHTAVAVGEDAFLWGGRNDNDGACNVLYCFDTGW